MTHEKAKITVLLRHFSNLLRMTSKDDKLTRNFNVARFFVSSMSYLVWNCSVKFISSALPSASAKQKKEIIKAILTGKLVGQITFLVFLTRSKDRCICNGNRTKWSPIWSVIIRVIKKIGRSRSGSLICWRPTVQYDDRQDWTTRSPIINSS